MENTEDEETSFVLVYNIPADYHTADLRRFFADHVERGKFLCFHFRHRLCSRSMTAARDSWRGEVEKRPTPANDAYSRETCARVHRAGENGGKTEKPPTCCIVKIKNSHLADFLSTYQRKSWLDSEDCELPTVCRLARVTDKQTGSPSNTTSVCQPTSHDLPPQSGDSSNTGPSTTANRTRDLLTTPLQFADDGSLPASIPPMSSPNSSLPVGSLPVPGPSSSSPETPPLLENQLNTASTVGDVTAGQSSADVEILPDFLSLPELRPPNIMPRGNVGTSTKFFLDAIRDCRLPAKLIGKLKLEFPKGARRKYGNVCFEYEQKEGRVFTLDRKKLQKLNSRGPEMTSPNTDSGPDDDDDTCEEWERHEALHNDVQANRTIGRQVNSSSYLAEGGDYEQQPGTKQKPYEDEIELVWEKGGSGLNFYTDAQVWKAAEGDFDEQTTDDWDVDMSVYYEKDTVHDKDAADRFEMRRAEFLRRGQHSESVFAGPPPRAGRGGGRGEGKRKWPDGSSGGGGIGRFEAHTRGFGGKIMRQSGWREGEGLGPTRSGLSVALDGEEEGGQAPWVKTGLGYHGERVVFQRPPPPERTRISTAYTGLAERDPAERLERSNPPLYMKFRDQPVKFHSGGVQGSGSGAERST